ncbi:MAG: transglycosylase domain-containing protein [Spirochaetales bacterium]|nr:transglycosylase domain-containing protein [Spirochaetales bacterium]
MARHNRRLIPAAFFLGLVLGVLLWGLWPDPRLTAFVGRKNSRRILDRSGVCVAVLPVEDGLRREYRELEHIPGWIVRGFLRSEDRFFYFHPGIDPVAVFRAAWTNLRSGTIESGASTVTMQLAAMIWPTGGGYPGKIAEALKAVKLELKLSKKEILELWLNHLPFGNNIEGISSAAQGFFGRDLSTLTPSEVLLLSIIPRRPALYTPVKDNLFLYEAALKTARRWNIDPGDLKAALAQPAPQAPFENRAPHFVRALSGCLDTTEDRGRGEVQTGLDIRLQENVLGMLRAELSSAGEFRITNGAVLITENATGEILCYLGSGDWYDEEHSGQIDGIRMERQPGSTLKPFLYAAAIEKGYHPATMLADVPLTLGETEVYMPQNNDNRYRGPVLLRKALVSSLNIPAVDTVVHLGVQNFADVLIRCGFSSIQAQRDTLGSGIAVGNGEVSLYELVQGFSVFSRDGLFIPLGFTPRQSREPVRVFTPVAAALLRDILTRHIKNPFSAQPRPFEGLFKTGTSNQFNNIWALGSSRKYTIGVWMGNFSGETVMGKPGSSIPLSLALKILMQIDSDSRFTPASEVPGISRLELCSLSGLRATEHCPGRILELVPSDSRPGFCTVHGPQGTRLPPQFDTWARATGGTVIEETTDVDISYPPDGAIFYLDPSLPPAVQSITVKINGRAAVTLYINGEEHGTVRLPASLALPLESGSHTLELMGSHNNVLATSSFHVFE